MTDQGNIFYHKKFNSNFYVLPENSAYISNDKWPPQLFSHEDLNLKSFSSFNHHYRHNVNKSFNMDQFFNSKFNRYKYSCNRQDDLRVMNTDFYSAGI